MSFTTIARSAQDEALIARVEAATVQEAWNNPTSADTEFGRNVQASGAQRPPHGVPGLCRLRRRGRLRLRARRRQP